MTYSFSIKSMLTAYSVANKRKFAHDRTRSVGASDVGQCVRKTWLSKHISDHSFTPDEDYVQSNGATDRGSVYENEVWVPALRSQRPNGSKLLFAGDSQETLHLGNLSATPDGLFINLARDCLSDRGIPDIGAQFDGESVGCLVVEAKTIDPRVNLKGQPKPEHEFQTQVQMGMIRENTRYRPNYSIISYTNASFLDDVLEFVVAWNPKTFAAAQARAEKIMSTNDVSTLAPEGKIAGGKECDYCSFKRACADISLQSMPSKDDKGVKLPPGLEQEFHAVAHVAASHAQMEKESAAKNKAAQERVKELLKEARTRKYEFSDGLKVSWSSVIGRENFDVPALIAAAKEAGIDVEQFSKVGMPSDRLAITLPKSVEQQANV